MLFAQMRLVANDEQVFGAWEREQSTNAQIVYLQFFQKEYLWITAHEMAKRSSTDERARKS